jgi:hypothetical protein
MSHSILIEIYSSLKKKWYLTLILAIFCAGGAFVEKYFFTDIIPQTGNMTYTKVIKFDNPVLIYDDNGNFHEVVINKVIDMWSNKNKFLDETENRFNYNKFDAQWSNKTLEDKFKWIDKHILVNYIGNNVYEITFRLLETDTKDASYVQQYALDYLDAYIFYVKNVSSIVVENPKVIVIDQYKLIENHDYFNKNNILIKYTIIGFILGAIIGNIIIICQLLAKKM